VLPKQFDACAQFDARFSRAITAFHSCLIMKQESPYDKWKSIVKDLSKPAVKDTFFLNIGGAIP